MPGYIAALYLPGGGGQGAPGRRVNLVRPDFGHAAMVTQTANRLVAGPAGQIDLSLDRCRQRIKRRPVPWAGRAENPDSGSADGGGHMHKAGIIGDCYRSSREG